MEVQSALLPKTGFFAMSQKVAERVRRLSRALSLVIAVLVFAGDQATKALVEDSIPEHTIIPILPHFFNLTHVKNAGAAFGLFSDSPALWKSAVLIVISGALLVTVIVIVWRNRHLPWEMSVGLALILGGAISNLFDRVRSGRVVDFLDFYYHSYHWPSFNLADSAIVIGASFLVIQVIFSSEANKES
jgi:signal peptidase II